MEQSDGVMEWYDGTKWWSGTMEQSDEVMEHDGAKRKAGWWKKRWQCKMMNINSETKCVTDSIIRRMERTRQYSIKIDSIIIQINRTRQHNIKIYIKIIV